MVKTFHFLRVVENFSSRLLLCFATLKREIVGRKRVRLRRDETIVVSFQSFPSRCPNKVCRLFSSWTYRCRMLHAGKNLGINCDFLRLGALH